MIKDSESPCKYLLDKAQVARSQEALGDGKCTRISYTASISNLQAAYFQNDGKQCFCWQFKVMWRTFETMC